MPGSLFVVLAIGTAVLADVFEHTKHVITPGQPIMERTLGMYTKEDSPGDAERDPFIKLDLDVTISNAGHGFVEVIVVQAHELNEIGLYGDDGVRYCCTQELMDKKIPGCDEVDTLIVRNIDGIDVKRFKTAFNGNENEMKLEGTYEVTTTGEHLLISSTCFPGLGTVELSGTTEWLNPYGYLPGSTYGLLPFYSAMSVIYLIAGCVWFLMNCCYWRDVITVQIYISVTLAMCMLEMGVWYFDYSNLNDNGIRHLGAAIFGVVISSFRRTFSRMLIVAVSLGYGVCRPTLGNNKLKMIVLGGAYFICDVSMEIVVRYSQTNEQEIDPKVRVVLSFLVSITNSVFYYWTFTALTATQASLAQRKQQVKLELYQRFFKVLVGAGVAAVIFSIYSIWYVSTDQMQTRWSQRWLLDSGMEVILYTIIMGTIAFLWRPTKNNQRYAYAQVGGSAEDLDGIQLVSNHLPTPKFDLSDSDDDDILSSDSDDTKGMASALRDNGNLNAKLE